MIADLSPAKRADARLSPCSLRRGRRPGPDLAINLKGALYLAISPHLIYMESDRELVPLKGTWSRKVRTRSERRPAAESCLSVFERYALLWLPWAVALAWDAFSVRPCLSRVCVNLGGALNECCKDAKLNQCPKLLSLGLGPKLVRANGTETAPPHSTYPVGESLRPVRRLRFLDASFGIASEASHSQEAFASYLPGYWIPAS